MGRYINIKNLSFSYGNHKEELKNINLSIHAGEVVVITGPSGSGKSTITRLVNGLVPRFYGGEIRGSLEIEGLKVSGSTFYERGRLVGNVFQDPRSQFFSNEVAGEIAFGCENYGYSHDRIVAQVERSAAEIGITSILEDKVRSLSYGMRQKVAIASAEAMEPEIYVMDEPSANLDIEATYQLSQIIGRLKEQGKTIVITEHRLYYLMNIADRFIYLEGGELKETFTRDEFKSLPSEMLKKLGLRTPYLYKCKPEFSLQSDKEPEVLRIEKLRKVFDGTPVLDGVDFSVRRGESIAIIGANGVGKSTVGKVLSGLITENEGTVWINGKKTKKSRRTGTVWYIPQDLDTWLFGDSLLNELLTGGKQTEQKIDEAKGILEMLDLAPFMEQHPATLSGGQKQRLALGVALINHADFIIMDEPTSGLDGRNMRKVANIIRYLSEEGKTVLIISHDVECILHCCSRAIRIEDGRVADDFPIDSSENLLDQMGYRKFYAEDA